MGGRPRTVSTIPTLYVGGKHARCQLRVLPVVWVKNTHGVNYFGTLYVGAKHARCQLLRPSTCVSGGGTVSGNLHIHVSYPANKSTSLSMTENRTITS